MRTAGRLLSIVTVVALVSPLVPSLVCARAGAPVMPCCKSQMPCDLQMQKVGCCSLERGPLSPLGSATTQVSSPVSSPGRSQYLAAGDPAVDEGAVVNDRLAGNRLWYPSSHDRSTPLYLRNAFILR